MDERMGNMEHRKAGTHEYDMRSLTEFIRRTDDKSRHPPVQGSPMLSYMAQAPHCLALKKGTYEFSRQQQKGKGS